jgi:predicted dehydrogenase
MERHLPALRALPGVTLVGVADAVRERAEAAAQRFETRAFADYRALLAESNAEVVAVCVSAPAHREAGLAVLQAGKHLFIEKPLAVTREDAEALVRGGEAAPGRAAVGFNLRAHRLVRRARDVARSGQLGTVEVVRSTLTSGIRFGATTPPWRKDRRQGGGAFFEMAVHHFDLWRFLLGVEILEVRSLNKTDEWMDDAAAIVARLSNGALATLALSQSTRAVNEIEILGQKGHLRLDNYRFDGLEVVPTSVYPGSIGYRLKGAVASLGAAIEASPIIRQGGDWAASYRKEWELFLEAVRSGGPVEATLEDGLRAVEPVLAAIESASRANELV